MNRPARLLAAGTALICLMGNAAACPERKQPGKVENKRPDPQSTEIPPHLKRTVHIEANGDRRYQVIVTTTLKGRVAPDYRAANWVDNPNPLRPYKQTFDYTSGQKHDIVVTVKADPNNDPATNLLTCSIEDKDLRGGHTTGESGTSLVQCNHTTER